MSLIFKRFLRVVVDREDISTIIIKDVRVQFEMEKFFGEGGHAGTITLYNLKAQTRSILLKRKVDIEQKPFTKISLFAGYNDRLGLAFRGDLIAGFSRREGPDWITKLTIYTGIEQSRLAVLDTRHSYTSITALTLLNNLAAEMNYPLTLSDESRAELSGIVLTGESISGRAWSAIVRVAESLGFSVSLDDAEILLTRSRNPVNPTEISSSPLLSRNTGQLGSPQITDFGATVRTLINHEIKIGKLFRVRSETTAAADTRGAPEQIFSAVKISLVGDTHGNDWSMEVTGAWFPEAIFVGRGEPSKLSPIPSQRSIQ